MIRRLSLLFVAALAACAPSAPPASIGSTDPDGQTIILWHSAEGDLRRALLAQIDTFNATNAWGILLVPEYHGDEAALMNHLTPAIASGRAPDMLLGRPLDALSLGDAIVPVEPYAVDERYGLSRADMADLYPALLDANRDPGRDYALIGFPVGGDGTVLVYNIDRLAAAGYLTPPDSWPLFREVCLVTTVDRNGDRQPDVFGLGFTPRSEFVSAWFRSRGVPILTPDGQALGFDGESGVRMFETIYEAAQGGCFYRTPGPNADVEALSLGRVAMIFADVSDLRGIDLAVKNGLGFRWGVTAVPHSPRPATLDVRGSSWIILRSTPEKQLAAWLFARWSAGSEQTLAWAAATGQLPVRASAAEALKKRYAETAVFSAPLDLLPLASAEPLVADWPAASEAVTRAVLAVVAGDSPDAAHAQALNEVSQIIRR